MRLTIQEGLWARWARPVFGKAYSRASVPPENIWPTCWTHWASMVCLPPFWSKLTILTFKSKPPSWRKLEVCNISFTTKRWWLTTGPNDSTCKKCKRWLFWISVSTIATEMKRIFWFESTVFHRWDDDPMRLKFIPIDHGLSFPDVFETFDYELVFFWCRFGWIGLKCMNPSPKPLESS